MTDAWGIDDGYWDISGTWHDITPETRRALRVAMGGQRDVDDPPPRTRPVWFVRQGTAPAIERPAELVLEDGTQVHAEHAVPPGLPVGYHDLHPNDGGPSTRLIVAPERCALPAGLRTWAWAVQLYATRSSRSWGIGDLADLRRIAEWSAELGAGYLAVNPLHAAQPGPRQEPSPYFPSSRRFRNLLYLRLEEMPGFDSADDVLVAAATAAQTLNRNRRIDRDAVYALKMHALDRLWSQFAGSAAFDRYRREQGLPLEQFATFNALAEHYATPWTQWPAEHRRPEAPGVERFATAHRDRVAFHAWVQWHLDGQLAGAAGHLPLIADLAIGVDPTGADSWVWQDVFAPGVRVGAPPDEFNTLGQDWGVPPFIPWKLRALGYEPLVQTIRSALRNAGGLRIDHVMGLFRLFWIPPGGEPADGGYVRFENRDLLEIVAVESARSGALIVGEDLGTVEDSARHALADKGVLSYRLVWFESDPPERFPEQALAAVTTHDLPTIAGLWSGSDLAEQQSLGLQPNGPSTTRMRHHLAEVAGVRDDDDVESVTVGTYRGLAAAPSMIVAGTLDDALLVEERPNMPGTTSQRSNWSIALPVPLETVESDGTVRAVAAALSRRETFSKSLDAHPQERE